MSEMETIALTRREPSLRQKTKKEVENFSSFGVSISSSPKLPIHQERKWSTLSLRIAPATAPKVLFVKDQLSEVINLCTH